MSISLQKKQKQKQNQHYFKYEFHSYNELFTRKAHNFALIYTHVHTLNT